MTNEQRAFLAPIAYAGRILLGKKQMTIRLFDGLKIPCWTIHPENDPNIRNLVAFSVETGETYQLIDTPEGPKLEFLPPERIEGIDRALVAMAEVTLEQCSLFHYLFEHRKKEES